MKLVIADGSSTCCRKCKLLEKKVSRVTIKLASARFTVDRVDIWRCTTCGASHVELDIEVDLAQKKYASK